MSADSFTVSDFVGRFHPDDMSHFIQSEKMAGHFLFSFIPKGLIPKYKVSYQLRIKDAQGKYKLFLHQAIAFTFDDQGRMATVLQNHSEIGHITTVNNKKVSFINVAGGPSYYNIGKITDIEHYDKPQKLLTNREIEILGLISEGLSSKETSAQLSISYETVRTHRNNILKKTNFKTIAQAVGYSIREGLI